jgi:hypothetical protein
VYLSAYLGVANDLRTIGISYIRAYSRTREEMVHNYSRLTFLAERWKYFDELSDASTKRTASLPDTDPDKDQRVTLRGEKEALILEAAKKSARILAELSSEARRPGLRLSP